VTDTLKRPSCRIWPFDVKGCRSSRENPKVGEHRSSASWDGGVADPLKQATPTCATISIVGISRRVLKIGCSWVPPLGMGLRLTHKTHPSPSVATTQELAVLRQRVWIQL